MTNREVTEVTFVTSRIWCTCEGISSENYPYRFNAIGGVFNRIRVVFLQRNMAPTRQSGGAAVAWIAGRFKMGERPRPGGNDYGASCP